MTNGKYTLGYWNIRGLAAPIRVAFAYAGKDLEEEVYTDNWGSTYKRFQDEATHPFPNLPYLITPDGDMLVQSNAIIRHVGRVLGLYGDNTEKSVMRVDELLEQVNDLRIEAVSNYYSPKGISDAFVSGTIPYYLDILNKHLSSANVQANGVATTGPFFFGAKPTVVDFLAYEILRTAIPVAKEKVSEYEVTYPKVFAFLKAVEALPELEAFFKSDKHALAANGPSANYGGAKAE